MLHEPLCDMSGIDQEVKAFVKKLGGMSQNENGVMKTADQDIPDDVPGVVNGPRGTAKWGIGKLHHVFSLKHTHSGLLI